MATTSGAPISSLRAAAYAIPTDKPEADGTFSWTKTTLIVVEAEATGRTGLGYTYSDASIVSLIVEHLAESIKGCDAYDVGAAASKMRGSVRNLGRSGLAATAVSAIDSALWDLKARLLDLPLVLLLGRRRERAAVYGSGGFTTYSDADLRDQLKGWVENEGCACVKMKIGSEPDRDPHRVEVAKSAIGDANLFVDANGAFDAKQALRFVHACEWAELKWFEEPVTSDDLCGLRLVRRSAPSSMEIAAGEYIFTLDDARRMLQAEAVDVLQADVTRCGGVTGFLEVAALCEAHHKDLSGHCAPALHLHVACAAPRFRHLEWFHDHVRIEHMLFDGSPQVRDGFIAPDMTKAGHGLAFKRADAARYLVTEGASQ